MSESATLLGTFGLGLLLGVVTFGGLLWTVRSALVANNPALWFGLSATVRMLVVGLSFYVLAGAGTAAMLSCFAGLLAARHGVRRYATER